MASRKPAVEQSAPPAKTPPAKAPAKKTPSKAAGTALTLWEEEMAGVAVAQASAEKPTGFNSSISFRSGIMSIDDDAVAGNALDVVILGLVHENQYYKDKYNPAETQVPDCYAVGATEEEMKPHPQSTDKQGDANGLCANCWANKMGSADEGRGKACKNVRRIAVVPADALDSAEAFEQAEMRTAKIPVMSTKGLGQYVRNKLAEEIKRPTWGVTTTMGVVPDKKSQFRVTFAFAELVQFTQELYEIVKRRAKDAQATLLASTYPVFEAEEAPARGRAKAPAAPAKTTRKKY
jgi:hypothetical protein